MMINYVYIIKNFENNKIYIGKTKRDVHKRFIEHLTEARAKDSPTYNYCLSRAIRKYGEQAFDVAILADGIPDDKLDLVESHYIDMYDSTNPDIGYNNSSGVYDTSDFKEYRELRPDDDYDGGSRVKLDSISDEEVNEVLRGLL